MNVTEAIRQLRIDLDDLLPENGEDAAALWKDEDLLRYLDYAQAEFVFDTLYLHRTISIPVQPGQESSLPENVIGVRFGVGRLVNARAVIKQMDVNDGGLAHDDYGIHNVSINTRGPGLPRAFMTDHEARRIRFIPEPAEQDTFEFDAYVEAAPLEDEFQVLNPRHQRFILVGAKALAYSKQDADAYDPNRVLALREDFERYKEQVYGERMRRRRRPGTIQYGGL